MSINLYKDIKFSMKDLEQTLIEGIKSIRGQEWIIKSVVMYDGVHSARIDYYAFDPIMANFIPNYFIVNDSLYISKQISENCYRFKLATDKEIDITKKRIDMIEKLVIEDKVIPIGIKYIKITNKNQLYDLLFDSNKTCNYLDCNCPFFIYSKEYDDLTNEIIAFAENKRLSKKLTK